MMVLLKRIRLIGTRITRITRIFTDKKTELSTYWNDKHYVRETFKVSRTFDFLSKNGEKDEKRLNVRGTLKVPRT